MMLGGKRLVACAVSAAVALALIGGCGGQKPPAFRVVSLEAEMRVVLPNASERLACDARRLESELVVESGNSRTYRIGGCGRFTTYDCVTRRGRNDKPLVACVHPHTGTELTNGPPSE
jgi:hypothetical protein